MQDIQARQYYSMAPMWDRIDPLAEKYYGISPYAYCGGDPVNRGDYDGREWGICKNDDGTLVITLDISLRFDTNISREYIDAIKAEMVSQFNRMFYEASDGKISGALTFNGNVVNGQVTPSLDLELTDDPYIVGSNLQYYSSAKVGNNSGDLLDVGFIASNAIHELLHTARLDHPFDTTQAPDALLFKTDTGYVTSPQTDSNIRYNVMSYPRTVIDGYSYNSLNSNIPQTMITPGQIEFLMKEIRLQQSGAGSHGGRDPYWDDEEKPGMSVISAVR